MSPTLISSRLPGLAVFIVLVVTTGCGLPTAARLTNAISSVQRTLAPASVALSRLNGTPLESLTSVAKR
jgi:hypothetical protein